ncbi:MAG: hypothetical protein EOP06_00175 [Proteobacteria bacterium]|nr:MAG: hypothetical protein EOP06_00175 [Pseudomonadota bacterium]
MATKATLLLLIISAGAIFAFQNCSGFSATSNAQLSLSSTSFWPTTETWQGAFTLAPGESVSAGDVQLGLSRKGVLTLTKADEVLWAPVYNGNGVDPQTYRLRFLQDGSLTLLSGATGIWSNGISGTPGRRLKLLSAPPYLQITNSDSSVVWYPKVPLVFFSALDNVVQYAEGRKGVQDFDLLFGDGTGWSQGLKHVNVVQFYAAFLRDASDEKLLRIFRFLRSHRIALAMEIGLLKQGDDGCGAGLEGYVGTGTPLTITQRIKALGGELSYVSIDESFIATRKPDGCRADVETAARQVAKKFNSLQAVFPGLMIGDTENLPTVLSNEFLDSYGKWVRAMNADLKAPLAFFHHDIDWRNSDWPSVQNVNRAYVESLGLSYGPIFNAAAGSTNDISWARSAKANIDLFNSSFPAPDDLIFQNWDMFPSRALPETDASTQTSVVRYYFSSKAGNKL